MYIYFNKNSFIKKFIKNTKISEKILTYYFFPLQAYKLQKSVRWLTQ